MWRGAIWFLTNGLSGSVIYSNRKSCSILYFLVTSQLLPPLLMLIFLPHGAGSWMQCDAVLRVATQSINNCLIYHQLIKLLWLNYCPHTVNTHKAQSNNTGLHLFWFPPLVECKARLYWSLSTGFVYQIWLILLFCHFALGRARTTFEHGVALHT